MKEAELRKHANCSICQKPIGASGWPLFWRVTLEHFGLNAPAVQRQTGLAMFLGSPALAAVMGPDEEMASPVMEPVTITACETCAVDRPVAIVFLALGLTL